MSNDNEYTISIKDLLVDRIIDNSILNILISRDTTISYKRTNTTHDVNSPSWGYFVFKGNDGNILIVDLIGNIYTYDREVLYSREDLSVSNYIGRCYNIWLVLYSDPKGSIWTLKNK